MPQGVSLVWKTEKAEETVAYCARVSSQHQDNPEISRLLSFLIRKGHWSPFEMVSMCVEINTTRAIAPQILRHRSFSFQEFSQRYANVAAIPMDPLLPSNLREREARDRQSSGREHERALSLAREANDLIERARDLYAKMVDDGVALECARLVLPLCSPSRLYMSGTLRSWIHYIQLRTATDTQLEHREIALAIKSIFISSFPIISSALGWVAETEAEAEVPEASVEEEVLAEAPAGIPEDERLLQRIRERTRTRPMIIAICGKARTGKDTVADYICETFNMEKVAIAQPLKEMVYPLFGFDEESKDEIDPRWGISPRQALQFFGTEIMQEKIGELIPGVGKTFWIKKLLSSLDAGKSYVISDLRFIHEYKELMKKGAIVLSISRDLPPSQRSHISEREADYIPCKWHIHNDRDKKALLDEVHRAMISILISMPPSS